MSIYVGRVIYLSVRVLVVFCDITTKGLHKQTYFQYVVHSLFTIVAELFLRVKNQILARQINVPNLDRVSELKALYTIWKYV